MLAALLILTVGSSIGPRLMQATPANLTLLNIMPPPCGFPPGVDDPCNIWAPYGPMIPKLQLQYYAYPGQEYQNFLNGKIDVMDTSPPPCRVIACFANPDILASPPQGGFDFFGIFFNAAGSTWKAWGCDWNTGTPFTNTEQTYVTLCGINMRQAFAHLVDRPSFTSAYGGSTDTGLLSLADPSPLAKDPAASNATAQCSWDPMFPKCTGAYRIQVSPGGFPQPGSPDFCAAADHIIAAGIATGKQAGSCVLTGVNPGVFARPIRFYINISSVTFPARKILGDGLTTILNRLFGGTAVSPEYCRYNCYQIIYYNGPNDNWDAYTYGYKLGGPYVDQFSGLFYSQQASNYCGGPIVAPGSLLNNPTLVCVPALDKDIKAANTTDISTYRIETLAAFNDFGKRAVDIPIYTTSVSIPALTSVGSLVNQRGNGYSNIWTMLNAQKGNYVPIDPKYSFGGGDPTILRWGQSSPTGVLNIFNIGSVSEFQAIGEIYDTLFVSSPVESGKIFCWMCNALTVSIDPNGNEHLDVQLKQTIRWHDDVPVDAKDVKFSLLNLRDYSLSAGGTLVGTLQDVNVLSPTEVDIVMNGQTVSNLYYLSTAYMIPRHLWELQGDKSYGDVGKVDPAKLDYSYDPLAYGTLIGSGPFVCRSLFPIDLGRVGTGCAKAADGITRSGQSIPVGGTLILQTYDLTNTPGNTDPFYQYTRSFNPAWGTGVGAAAESGQFQEFSWADQDNNVQVTVVDLVSVASCYGASGPTASCASSSYNYWLRPAFHPFTPNTISSEVAIVAAHLDDTWVYPYSWNPSNLENIVPFTP